MMSSIKEWFYDLKSENEFIKNLNIEFEDESEDIVEAVYNNDSYEDSKDVMLNIDKALDFFNKYESPNGQESIIYRICYIHIAMLKYKKIFLNGDCLKDITTVQEEVKKIIDGGSLEKKSRKRTNKSPTDLTGRKRMANEGRQKKVGKN